MPVGGVFSAVAVSVAGFSFFFLFSIFFSVGVFFGSPHHVMCFCWSSASGKNGRRLVYCGLWTGFEIGSAIEDVEYLGVGTVIFCYIRSMTSTDIDRSI